MVRPRIIQTNYTTWHHTLYINHGVEKCCRFSINTTTQLYYFATLYGSLQALILCAIQFRGHNHATLLFYFLMFDPDDDHLFLSAVGIGAGFASFENICSMIASGTERLGFLLIRGLAVGVMHIVSVFAMILGLVVARRFKALRLSSTVGALSLSMLFHGIYNLLVSQPGITSVIGYGLPLLTAGLLFLALRRLRVGE